MNTRSLWALGSSAVLSLACGAKQSSPGCLVGHGPYAAKYTVVSNPNACAVLEGDMLNIARYLQPVGAPVDAKFSAAPDYESGKVYVSPSFQADADAVPASGDLAAGEPQNGYCEIPTLSPASSATAGTSYQFTELRLFHEADIWGTQASAKLEYTSSGCTTSYDVSAVYPAVACASDQDPAVADPSKCEDPTALIDARFAVTCDPVLLMCVLSKQPLSLK
jgi:hypothetical protein